MMRRIVFLLLPLLLLAAAACGDDDGAEVTGSASGSASGGSASGAASDCEVVNGVEGEEDSELHLTLREFSIEVEEDGAEAGLVKIEAMNEGGEDHEVVVLEGALADVKVEDGEVVEDGLVGEIEAFPGGEECAGTFELAAGTYTLLCAIVDEMGHNHFEEGMATEIEVS